MPSGTGMFLSPTPLPEDIGEERRLAIAQAVKELEALAGQGLLLKRPVFFVPGWTSESAVAWLQPYTPRNTPTKTWIDRIFRNAADCAVYVTLTEESPRCHSFYDFGQVVIEKIGARRPCDCVGHSMGGLDIAAAIALCEPPLLNVRNFIAFGSPLRGTEWGELRVTLRKLLPKLLPYLLDQAKSMDPDQPFIQRLRSPESLRRLLSRAQQIYSLYGTRDMAVRRSPKISYKDLDPNWQGADPEAFKQQVRVIDIPGAEHTGSLGITQDPRAILWLVKILGELPLPQAQLNHGYLFRSA